MDVKIRRLEVNLSTLGTGVILLSLWNVAKTVLMMFLDQQDLLGVDHFSPDSHSRTLYTIILWGVVLLDTVLHLLVGLGARAEGHRRPKSAFYLVLDCFLILMSILAVVVEILTLFTASAALISAVITLLIDLGFLGFLLELAVTGFRLRRLKRRAALEEGGPYER